MIDQSAIILALIGIITGTGAILGPWIISRLNRLEKQVSELQKENRDLVIERANQAAEIAQLKSEIEQREDARQERDQLRTTLAARERTIRYLLRIMRRCDQCRPHIEHTEQAPA